jgi:hypothetical protein
VRPPRATAPASALEPLEPGAWTSLVARDVNVVGITLAPDGAVSQVSAAAHADASALQVCNLLLDVGRYRDVYPSIAESTAHSRAPDGGRSEYRLAIRTPWYAVAGDLRVTATPTPRGPVVDDVGLSGDFAHEATRWDLWPDPHGGSTVVITGTASIALHGMVAGALVARDAWFAPGLAAAFRLVWLRATVYGAR